MSYDNNDLRTMLHGLRESQTAPTKREAGRILVDAGWSCFPLANNAKWDEGDAGRGVRGMSYLNSTIDPGLWESMADFQMDRWECRDVNIALTPGRCVVPLLAIDLDGADAITRFFQDATSHNHTDVPLWLRVNTTRPDYGRHVYFIAPEGQQYSNSQHIWGGEVRSGKGHVVLPPSTTELGRYAWVGESLQEAPTWVLENLRRASVGGTANIGHSEIEAMLDKLSQHDATTYGEVALGNMIKELVEARPGAPQGGRNPTLAKVVNRLLDLALERHVNALVAISEVQRVYIGLFSLDEKRNPAGEVVRCVQSWFRNKEDLGTSIEHVEGVTRFIHAHGGSGGVRINPNIELLQRAQDTVLRGGGRFDIFKGENK